MWAVRWIFIAIIIVGVLVISQQNSVAVDVRLVKWNWSAIPLYFVIFFSFAAGMISFLLIAVYDQLRHHVEVRKYRNEIKQLNKKILELESRTYEDENVEFEDEGQTESDNVLS